MTVELIPGDLYMNCDYHPVLCSESDQDDVSGISILDGSMPRSCSIEHCNVRRLTIHDALNLRKVWDLALPRRVERKMYEVFKSKVLRLLTEDQHQFILRMIYQSDSPISIDSLCASVVDNRIFLQENIVPSVVVGFWIVRMYCDEEIEVEEDGVLTLTEIALKMGVLSSSTES
jgi:hypothetical protein